MSRRITSFLTLGILVLAIFSIGGCGGSKVKPSKDLAEAWKKKKKKKAQNQAPKKKEEPPKKVAPPKPPKLVAGASIKLNRTAIAFDPCFVRFCYVDADRGGTLQISNYQFDSANNDEQRFYIHAATTAESAGQLVGGELACRFFLKNGSAIYSNVGGTPFSLRLQQITDEFIQGTITGMVMDPDSLKYRIEGDFTARLINSGDTVR